MSFGGVVVECGGGGLICESYEEAVDDEIAVS